MAGKIIRLFLTDGEVKCTPITEHMRYISRQVLTGHEFLLAGFDGIGHANRYRKDDAEPPRPAL